MHKKYYPLSLKITFISIVVNFILSLVKFIIGIISNSISIITDALHSFSDLASSLVVGFSLKLSRKPADRQHPFGHGRIEDIGGLLVCFIFALVGFHFFTESLARLTDPPKLVITTGFIILVIFSAIVKLFLGIFTSIFAKKIDSQLLFSDASHHYSDFLTSFAVFVGLLYVRKGFYRADVYLGFVVSLIIMFWAIKLGKKFIHSLIGSKASRELYQKIREIVFSFPKIENVHDIAIHAYGHKRVISLHVVVKNSLSLEEAHTLADSVEKKIFKDNLGKCVVHVDLEKKPSKKRKTDIEKNILQLIRGFNDIKDFHGLEIIHTETLSILNLHLLFDKNITLEKSHEITHQISHLLKGKFGFSKVNIHVEPYGG